MPGSGDSHPSDAEPERSLRQQSSMRLENLYRRIALDLQRQLDELHRSRTWQLSLAFGLARRSFRDALRLPARIWLILSGRCGPPPEGRSSSHFALQLAERGSTVAGWPSDRPLVSVVILSAGAEEAITESMASLVASTLQDFEVLLVHHRDAEIAGVRERLDARRRLQTLETECPDSADGRNTAVEAAEGKYVVLLRAGDRLDATFLEKSAWALEYDSRFGFAYAQATPEGVGSPGRIEPFRLDCALRYDHVADNALFRREAWLEAGGFRAETKLDLWDFWVTLGTLGWSGLLAQEELIHPGEESRQALARLRETADDPAEADKIRRRHAALLESPPAGAPTVAPKVSAETAAARTRSEPVAFAQRRFLAFNAHKPAILCVVPWLDIGGAEQVVLQILRGLSNEFSFAVVSTLPADHNRTAEFREATPWVYHLPASAADPGSFLADLAAVHGVRGVLISASEAGYRALPALKQRGLWTADIVHNTAPEGHLDLSIGCDGYLDVHFACGRVQAAALRNGAGSSESRIRTVWTAVDAAGTFNPRRYEPQREALRAEFGLEDRDIVLAYVGRLSIEKDVPLFVAAVSLIVRQNPGLRIRALLAGDGPELLRVEQVIEQERLWNEVRLLGDSRRIPEILAASDYMLLTSKSEGSPITILEAMSLGRVVLSTAVGNVREVIENGVNGCVIESRDPAAFAACFEEIRRAPERERRMREAARRTILERFAEPQMLAGYAQVLRAALGPAPGSRSV
jgi:glycosyltransferase involved in cell wall biosynthesis